MSMDRLQKILAEAGVASRRASEVMISAGRVTVDGRVARLGDRVDPAIARIEVDGHKLPPPGSRTYVVLHKPAGVTSTTKDPHADETVVTMLPTALVPDRARLYPVGRLDRDSEGLLLLTNDGDWAERVLHPRFGVEREYAVGVGSRLNEDQVATLQAGIALDEGPALLAGPLRTLGRTEVGRLVELLDPAPAPGLTWYRARLAQGWKRQLRRMFAAVGSPVVRLVRVRIGPLGIGALGTGQSRRLSEREVTALGGSDPRPPAPRPSVPRPPAPRVAGSAGPGGDGRRQPVPGQRPGGKRTPRPSSAPQPGPERRDRARGDRPEPPTKRRRRDYPPGR